MGLRLETLSGEEAAGAAVREAVMQPLIAFNDVAGGPHRWLPVAVVLRDDAGGIVGGLWGECLYDWLRVDLLVVPEGMRGQGWGSRVMAVAEGFALERGLAGVWLDTFGFQARGFYERLGFSCFGTLEGHPVGGCRHFMAKRLGPGA